LNLSSRFYYSWKEEEYDDRKGQIGLGRQHNEYKTTKYGVHLFLEWPTAWQTLTLTSEAYREEYEPRDLLRPNDPGDSKRDAFILGLQDSFLLFDEALVITPGFRFQAFDDELKNSVDQFGDILEGERERDNYASPQMGLKYRPCTWLTLKVNLARYTRKPSFFELFGDHGFFTSNPDLEAEEGLNWDVGFDLQWKPYKLWLRRVSVSAAFFRSDVDDIITMVYDARGIGRAVNISEATLEGVESSVVLEGLRFFRFVGNVTWQDTENRGSIAAFNGKKLPGRFEKSFLGRLEATYRTVKVYGEYICESDMYYDTPNLLEAKTKKEINMGVSWLFRSCLFSFEGKNLSNDRYEDFNGYPLPGRAFYFTVKYDFT
jgi:iron complex outermembrane receptor protein